MGDACDRCRGHGRIPKVRGAYDVWIPCPACRGTGRRGGAPTSADLIRKGMAELLERLPAGVRVIR